MSYSWLLIAQDSLQYKATILEQRDQQSDKNMKEVNEEICNVANENEKNQGKF
jgi:hypothetical protein